MAINLTDVLQKLDARSQRDLARSSMLVVKTISAQVSQQIRLSETDKIRCLRWLTWARRHAVPLSYVIRKAFEWGEGTTSKSQRLKRKATLFPISLAAMTGSMCYEWLVEEIGKDWDNRPVTEALRQKMLNSVLVSPAASQGKLLDFATIDAFADDYSEHVRLRRKARESAELLLSKSKPFRGNPFR